MYIPPPCNAVNFTLDQYIIIPACNAVNFDLIGDIPVGITISDSKIEIYNNTWYFTSAYMIEIDPTRIDVLSAVQSFHALSNIQSDSSVISIVADTNQIRILPDCISENSYIHIHADIAECKRPGPQDLPIGINTTKIVPFKKPIILDEHTNIPWGEAIWTDNLVNIKPSEFIHADDSVESDWIGLPNVDNLVNLEASDLETKINNDTEVPWRSFYIADKLTDQTYGYKYEITNPFVIPYLQPGPKDRTLKVDFDFLDRQTLHYKFPWNAPAPQDKHHEVPWGPISMFGFCNARYWPPDDGIVNFKISTKIPWTLQEQSLVGACTEIVFDIKGYVTDPRCPYEHYRTGRRDTYGGGGVPVTNQYFPPLKETYYMFNIVTVKRLPDNVPIEVTSVSIKYDKSSYTWSFSLTIGKDKTNYLDLIKPNPLNLNIFTDIEISINNWKWTCRVESFSESRVFAKDSWTVTGRSPSMELGSPLNQKTSYTFDPNGSSMTAGGQIIGAVLEGTMLGIDDTGWSVDWSAYGSNIHTGFDPNSAADWGIKPNTFSWKDLTQIEVIKQLTDSIGAFLITKPDCSIAENKVLYARPIYNIPPWHWKLSSPYKPTVDHMIRTSYSTEIGRGLEMLSGYNAVYVMGQSESDAQKTNISPGIPIVEVYRDGVGPGERIYAPDVTSPWLTTWQACTEAGRPILCDTGAWIRHSLRLFSLANALDSNPTFNGLIYPGDYVQVEEGAVNWFGDVVSTSIDVSVNGGVTLVYQTIEVNEYKDN